MQITKHLSPLFVALVSSGFLCLVAFPATQTGCNMAATIPYLQNQPQYWSGSVQCFGGCTTGTCGAVVEETSPGSNSFRVHCGCAGQEPDCCHLVIEADADTGDVDLEAIGECGGSCGTGSCEKANKKIEVGGVTISVTHTPFCVSGPL